MRYFTRDKIRRLINAAQGDFQDLVKAALFTGCWYGELIRLRAGDFNPDSGMVFLGQSKRGKARHVVLTGEGQKFFKTLTAGQPGDTLMHHHAWREIIAMGLQNENLAAHLHRIDPSFHHPSIEALRAPSHGFSGKENEQSRENGSDGDSS